MALLLGLVLAGPLSASAAAVPRAGTAARTVDTSAAAAKAKPKPEPVPKAKSWVGGDQLIETRELVDLPAGVPRPPVPHAVSWLVADLDTRQILAGRRVHVPLRPASTLKIFTALALAHRLDPSAVYTGRPDDAAVDGTKVGVVPGSTYTINDLLHGMLMSSGNDCANAIGNAVGGKREAVKLIQAEAVKLGAFDTIARTTNGLDAKGQASSSYDLALAGSALVKEPAIEKILLTKTYNFPGAGKSLGKKRKHYSIQSHDKLIWNYPGAIGVKNGYTTLAQGTFVGAATRHGHTYLAVVMKVKGNSWRPTAALLDWAFAHGSEAKPVGTLVQPGQLAAMTGPGLATSAAQATSGTSGTSKKAGASTASATMARTGTPKRAGLGGDRKLWLGAAALALVLGVLAAGWRFLRLNRRGAYPR